MKIIEFGNKSKRKIILLHGFQSPWQVWEKCKDFHIIVPIVSGNNPEENEDFMSDYS